MDAGWKGSGSGEVAGSDMRKQRAEAGWNLSLRHVTCGRAPRTVPRLTCSTRGNTTVSAPPVCNASLCYVLLSWPAALLPPSPNCPAGHCQPHQFVLHPHVAHRSHGPRHCCLLLLPVPQVTVCPRQLIPCRRLCPGRGAGQWVASSGRPECLVSHPSVKCRLGPFCRQRCRPASRINNDGAEAPAVVLSHLGSVDTRGIGRPAL